MKEKEDNELHDLATTTLADVVHDQEVDLAVDQEGDKETGEMPIKIIQENVDKTDNEEKQNLPRMKDYLVSQIKRLDNLINLHESRNNERQLVTMEAIDKVNERINNEVE